ncbi:MAG: DNA polymerase IV [Acidobacteria bacterium]|nr:DNA polymerase IV [Acidobacteriota bacterium]
MERTIFHVDMDAFYAAVEQRDCPEYRDKPVIVGADPREGQGRGVVAACSYEARRLGIHSALPISRAFRLCPDGVYLRPDLKKYVQVSKKIRAIFRTLTDSVEPLSIDEAFLDMSHAANHDDLALEVARSLKDTIFQDQGLAASIGIAPNKFVAKIASDIEKPDGLVLVSSAAVQSFLDPLSISRLWGVGPKTESKLVKMGIKTILQLRHYDPTILVERFGKLGEHLWRLSNGIDERSVVVKREAKSIGHEKTFPEDVGDIETVEKTLLLLCGKVSERLCTRGLYGGTVTLKLRYSDFTTITRQTTFPHPVESADELYPAVHRLLRKFRDPRQKIRLVGVSVSSLVTEADQGVKQMKLF